MHNDYTNRLLNDRTLLELARAAGVVSKLSDKPIPQALYKKYLGYVIEYKLEELGDTIHSIDYETLREVLIVQMKVNVEHSALDDYSPEEKEQCRKFIERYE